MELRLVRLVQMGVEVYSLDFSMTGAPLVFFPKKKWLRTLRWEPEQLRGGAGLLVRKAVAAGLVRKAEEVLR